METQKDIINTYDVFSGNELQVAEKIQQLRIQLLIHSCIYYEFNTNLITDKQWDEKAKELLKLQTENPEISEGVIWYDAFKDWDASTGAFLPLKDHWVVSKAKKLLYSGPGGVVVSKTKKQEVKVEQKPKNVSKPKTNSLKLF